MSDSDDSTGLDLLGAVEQIDFDEVFAGTPFEDIEFGEGDESAVERLGERLGGLLGQQIGAWAGALVGAWLVEDVFGGRDGSEAAEEADGSDESEGGESDSDDSESDGADGEES